MTEAQRLIEKILTLITDKFFGVIELHIQNGKIVNIKKSQNLKPEEIK
jgi:hypothetical protein